MPTEIYSKDVKVRAYYRKDGTYVRPHYRSHQDNNFYNNYSTRGNINPYTRKTGSKTINRNKRLIKNTYNNNIYNNNAYSSFIVEPENAWKKSYNDCIKRGKYILLDITMCIE